MTRRYESITDNPVVRKIIDALTRAATIEAAEVLITHRGRLECPHCHARDNFGELDYDVRSNEGHVTPDPEQPTLHISQTDAEFKTLFYFCTACNRIVTMPRDSNINWS